MQLETNDYTQRQGHDRCWSGKAWGSVRLRLAVPLPPKQETSRCACETGVGLLLLLLLLILWMVLMSSGLRRGFVHRDRSVKKTHR